MTAGRPGGQDAGPAAAGDTERCVCLVAGYHRRAAKITAVLGQAETLIARSPLLDDFLTLRFTDFGAEPGEYAVPHQPARQLAAALAALPAGGGRTHFAVIVVEKSARAIEELLAACAADPLLDGLRVRFAGIASREDRPADLRAADIACSPGGSWGSERALAGALYGQCEALPRYFAARGEPGLTAAEVQSLLAQRPPDPAGGAAGPVPDAGSGQPVPDALDDTGGWPGSVGPSSVGPAEPGPRVSLAVNWRLPGFPRRKRQPAAPEDQPLPATAAGLVYLLAPAEPNTEGDPALDRLQAVLHEVDQWLSVQPACAFRVRLVHGEDAEPRGEVRDAGQLRRRESRRSLRTEDFAGLLAGLRAALRRDNAQLRSSADAAGLVVARPAVIIAAADPPMADRAAAAAFAGLAAEATVAWLVPGKSEGLVSPAFANVPGVTVFTEHAAVADDIGDMLLWPGAVSVPRQGTGR